MARRVDAVEHTAELETNRRAGAEAHAGPRERPFWNPYLAGFALGLVLLATYLLMGFGVGASSGPTRLAVAVLDVAAPQLTESNGYFAKYVSTGTNIFEDWMFFEVIGVLLGGLFAAYSGGRLRWGHVERGPRITTGHRFALALLGGGIMGFAARLARGCTSGQALTGGAVFSLGSWVFMLAVFAGAYLLAPMVRRQWR